MKKAFQWKDNPSFLTDYFAGNYRAPNLEPKRFHAYSAAKPKETEMDNAQIGMRFDGITYDHARDSARLGDQMTAVFDLMKDGQWRTLQQISIAALAPESSVSARLRDLRKPRFGGYRVARRYVCKGCFVYQLVLRENEAA